MAVTIDQAFITQFESEVKLAYQQMGARLRNTVRLRTGINGSTVRFQKVGTGAATSKGRHGDVPVMNAVHSYVTATMEDWYAGDYVDKLDELKVNIDERQVTVNTGAYALGRKIDSLVITALGSSLPAASYNRTGMAGALPTGASRASYFKDIILGAFRFLNDANVPDDGDRYCLVGPYQWNDLLNITEFASSDYVGADQLPWLRGGMTAKRWLNTVFMLHTGLDTANSAGSRVCYMYHKSAIGLGEGASITTDITWQGTKASWFIDNMMSAGAIRIEDTGVYQFYGQEA